MIASWLRVFFRYAEMSTSSLRVLRTTYGLLGVLSSEREAIEHELAMRAWAEWVEARLSTTIGWCRGGRS